MRCKCDLTNLPLRLHPHFCVLQSINKVADIIETQYSKVDLKKVLGIRAFDLEKTLEQDPEFLEPGNVCPLSPSFSFY